jgi:hypothetical protein
MRPEKKLDLRRSQKKKLSSRKRLVALVLVPDHPLVVLARSESDERRKRFLVALSQSIATLTDDDMNIIEGHLHKHIGSAHVKRAAEALK